MSAIEESTGTEFSKAERGNDSAHRIKHGEKRKAMELRVEMLLQSNRGRFPGLKEYDA